MYLHNNGKTIWNRAQEPYAQPQWKLVKSCQMYYKKVKHCGCAHKGNYAILTSDRNKVRVIFAIIMLKLMRSWKDFGKPSDSPISLMRSSNRFCQTCLNNFFGIRITGEVYSVLIPISRFIQYSYLYPIRKRKRKVIVFLSTS